MTASLPGGPINQTDEALVFLAAYGCTMWAVQKFEYHLGCLSIVRAPVKKPDRLIDTTQKAYSALRKQFAIYQHRLERASVKELQNLLPEDLSDSLRSELDELIEIRNHLAHRYLHRTLEGSSVPDLRSELQVVEKLRQRFTEAGDKLRDLIEQHVATRPPNMSDAQFEALQRLGRAAASGLSLDDALRAIPRGSLRSVLRP